MSREAAPSKLSADDTLPTPTPPFAAPTSPARSLKSSKTMITVVGTFAKGLTTRNASAKPKESADEKPETPANQASAPPPQTEAESSPIVSPSAAPPPTKPANAKAQNIVSRLTQKLRLPPVRSNSQFRPPPTVVNTIAAPGRREAALRARGLIPQKDLSEQERERDWLVSEPTLAPSEVDQPQAESAADVIKRQWEEKNGISTTTALTRASPLDSILSCDPCLVPLPPSPVLFGTEQTLSAPHFQLDDVSLDEACLVPLPPSPRTGSIRSIKSNRSIQSGTNAATQDLTPCTALSSATVTPIPSAIALTLEDDLLLPSSPLSVTESEVASSIATPSLTADSMSRSISITSASSATEPTVEASTTAPEELKIQTSLAPTIPVIMESPVEEFALSTVPETDDPVEPTSAKTEGDELKPGPVRSPVRRATDSAIGQKTGRKLSIRNIQRSVVGSLYRKPKKPGFDASKLPPSPVHPSSQSPPQSPVRRTACSPAIHTSGSILLETSLIEDDESRRLSEMAFLT